MSVTRASRRAALGALGYEVTSSAGGSVHAYKARGQSLAYEIVVDASGQLRFTATRVVQPSHTVTSKSATRAYRITREQQRITTIMYELREGDALDAVVRELEQIASGE